MTRHVGANRPPRQGAKGPGSEPREDDRGGELDARRAALDLTASALAQRGGLDAALSRPPFSRLEPRDRALARMIAMTALRRRGEIDARLAARLDRPPPEAVMNLLRIGAVQLLAMDIPPFAAVDTTVRLAAADRATRGFKGLINAVLRGLSREPGPAPDARPAPAWLDARWRAAFGAETADAIEALIVCEPPTDLSFRGEPTDAEIADLEGERLPGGGVRTARRGEVSGWPGYADGRWWVQDAAAAVPARLLRLGPGDQAADLCAAPGGKTLQLAARGARVTAVDRSDARLNRLRTALRRTGLEAEVVVADASAWRPGRTFDAVLLDAPCSATGTFRRHPDVLWGARADDIRSLAAVQSRLLDAAADLIRPGGSLVYCVCSLEREEGEGQIRALLARRPDLGTDPIRPGEGGAPAASTTSEGWLRILPHHAPGGLDGFFVARLTRDQSEARSAT